MPIGPNGGQLVEIAAARLGGSVAIPGGAQAGMSGMGTAALTFTAVAAAYTTNDIAVGGLAELALDITATTTTTNWILVVQRKGADGVYYPIVTSATHTDSGKTVSLSIGSGVAQGSGGTGIADAATGNTNFTAPFPFGDVIRLVFTPSGAFTGTLSLKGK